MAEQVIKNPNTIKNLFKQKFSSNLNVIYVNTLKREVNFREVSVAEQKALSKTVIENENRRDIIYDTQCAMINKLCLESDPEQFRKEAKLKVNEALEAELQSKTDLMPNTKEYQRFCDNFKNKFIDDYVKDHVFDIYKLTEFDRMRILMHFYQNNYTLQPIKYKCKNCGTENEYQLDFQNIIDKLNKFELDDVVYTVEDANFIYNFILNYPNVKAVSQFYKQYTKQNHASNQKEADAIENLGTIEYINLYIKQVELIDKNNDNEKTIVDFSLLPYSEFEELLATFPQNIIFNEKTGVLKYISDNIINKVNSVFEYHKCLQCGEVNTEGIGNPNDFL